MNNNDEISLGSSRATIKHNIIKSGVIPYRCSADGCPILDQWNGKKISLHLDHIDGDTQNNRVSNLRFLCPNCHSQTPTYCTNKRTRKLTSREFSDLIMGSISSHSSVRELLQSLGLSDQGSHYTHVYRVLDDNHTDKGVIDFRERCLQKKRSDRAAPRVSTRRALRPTREELIELIGVMPVNKIAQKYGLSDNSIRKWCKNYKIDHKSISPFSHKQFIPN